MTFDPRAHIEPFEQPEDWSAWVDGLMDRFAASPEADTLQPGTEVSWAGLVLEYAGGYHGQSLATLTPYAVENVLLDVFPRKVSVDPSEGGDIVREMRAFFAFSARAFELSNMAACAAVLAPGMEARVEAALADTSKFGMAKSLVMGGTAAGFDMHTQEGMDAWMRVQNAGLFDRVVAGARPDLVGGPPPKGKTLAERKAARKRQRKARKKNRR